MVEPEPERVRAPPPPPDTSIFSSGTYVIQIPKDQIYRIPPPENALIVERHRNPSVTSSPRGSCCLRFVLPIVIIFLLILLALFLPPLLSHPIPPFVKLTKFKLAPSQHDFRVELDILNQNSAGSISFKSPSRASLSFRNHELAAVKFPLISQAHGSKRQVALALHAKSLSSFPKEFQKRLKNDKSKLPVAMLLKINLAAEMTRRLTIRRDVGFVVSCSFRVNTLGENSKTLSQDCESKRQ